jgi:hypothetical protein
MLFSIGGLLNNLITTVWIVLGRELRITQDVILYTVAPLASSSHLKMFAYSQATPRYS